METCGVKSRLHVRFFEKLSRRQRTVVATCVINFGDKMLKKQGPPKTRLVIEPEDTLQSLRKCKKKVAGWLHERQCP